MPIPETFDIALCVGMSALDRVIAAAVRAGRLPAAQGLTVQTVRWSVFETSHHEVRLRATVEGIRDVTPVRIAIRVRVRVDDIRPRRLLAAAVSVDESVAIIAGTEVPDILSEEQKREVLDAVNAFLVGRPLLDIDAVLRALRIALELALEDDEAEDQAINNTTVELFGAGADDRHQEGLLVLYDLQGVGSAVTSAASIVRRERDIALGIASRLMNQRILTGAVEEALGPLPAVITRDDQTVTVSRLSLFSQGETVRLSASLNTAGHDVTVEGPIHLFYSQPDHALWVSGRDVTADVAIPDWVMPIVVLTIPLVIGVALGLGALAVKAAADAIATDFASETVQRTVREAGLLDFGGAVEGVALGEGETSLVVRYVEIDDGALLMGASLYAGAESVRAVGATGARRLRWVQFDNGDLLSVPDAAALIEAGRLVGTGLHAVNFRPGSIRTYLRANHDETRRNNLRELPNVDLDLFPGHEHPGMWTRTYLL